METHTAFSEFKSSDSWSILTDIEKSIKAKIEAIGTPLKNWDVSINYGIKTGYNDAFIIDSAKREQILSNCQSEEERKRTAEIIRPILRGRDIYRYGYKWADLWLINTHNGFKDGVERIHIEDYPSIKQHLDNHFDKLESRADKGDTPYNLRNCAYLDLLVQPKIIWGEISDRSKFCLDVKGVFYPEATTFMLSGEHLPYLLAFLNCNVSEYLFSLIGTTTGVGTVRWKKYKILELPVPMQLPKNQYDAIVSLCNKIINTQDVTMGSTHDINKLNELISNVYGLSNEEVNYINSHLRK